MSPAWLAVTFSSSAPGLAEINQRIAGNDLEENVAPHVGGGRCNFPRLGFGDDPKAKYDGTYC